MIHRLTLILLLLASAAFAQDRPNIVLILCDDLGYADIGIQGAKHKTPAIDRLASEGVRLTSFYAASNVCTPTRASIMTGCYPQRVGLHQNQVGNWVLFPGDKVGLNPSEITIAKLLKTRGYATGIFGKWHLGDQPEFMPTRHGFDEFLGIPYPNDMSRAEHPNSRIAPLPLLKGEKVIEAEPDQHYFTRRFTEASIDFIQRHKAEPFFLFISHPMPHWPQFSSEPFAGKSGNGRYGDSVTELDWSTDQLLKTLKDLDLDSKTLVIFLSDNGGALFQGADNSPLHGAKGSTWEGGHRVPFIVRWPGRIPAGKVVSEMAITFDLYPTLANLAAAPIPTDRIIDGKDIWPLLAAQEGAKTPHEAFFYYHVGTLAAVRSGPWKLILDHQIAPQGKPDQKTPVKAQLYNLDSDMGESHDVLNANPDVVKRLTALADKCREDLGDDGRPGKDVRPPGEVANPRTLLPRGNPAAK